MWTIHYDIIKSIVHTAFCGNRYIVSDGNKMIKKCKSAMYIGLRIIVMSTNKMRADMMMIASLLCCSLITLVLATIFKITVEKLTEGLCKRIH